MVFILLQLLKVESPFVSFSVDDHRKIVSMLPQSHVSIHLASNTRDDTRVVSYSYASDTAD